MAGCPESRRLNLLAFDTSTDVLRVAVQRGAAAALSYEGPGGAQASARLIPVIQQLLSEAGLAIGQLDAIVFGRGPGSFTGIRTACSVAQGLAFGSGVPVLPVDTLLAIAEDARPREGFDQLVSVLDARMDEVYFAAYAYEALQWRRQSGPALVGPEAVPVPPGWALAGNAVQVYADRLPEAVARFQAAPTATALLRLAPALLASGQAVAALDAMPLYIRDKVAQTTDERALARAIKESKP
jgi:tRNA threonylcarbamoyladenosine biosynthesis protein TsaB